MNDPDTADRSDTGSTEVPPRAGPLPKRLVDLVFDPGSLFSRLAQDPKWAATLFLGAGLIALGVVLIPDEVLLETSRRQLLRQGQEVPDGFEDSVALFRSVGAIAGPIFWIFWMSVIAALVTLVFSFVLGDEGRFKQYWSAVTHAMVLPALGTVALVPLKISAGDGELVLSIGTFLGPLLEPGYLLGVLESLDLFALWAYVLLAVAASRIDRRRSVGSALVPLLGIFLATGMIFGIFRS